MKLPVVILYLLLSSKTVSGQQTIDLNTLLNSLTLQPKMFRDSLTNRLGFQFKSTGEVPGMPVATDTFFKGNIRLVKYYGWKTIVAANGEGLVDMAVMKDTAIIRMLNSKWDDEDEWNASYLYLENLSYSELDHIRHQAIQLSATENCSEAQHKSNQNQYQIFYFQNMFELDCYTGFDENHKYYSITLSPVN